MFNAASRVYPAGRAADVRPLASGCIGVEMRAIFATAAIVVMLSAGGVAACPEFPGPRAAEVGGPVAYTVMNHINRVPPPARHIPIPDAALDTVHIRLMRSGCYGTCPSYVVEISGDGKALYRGGQFTLTSGDHTFSVPTDTARCLLENFRSADFWSLARVYSAPVSDNPTAVVTLEIGGRKKSVTDYVGRWVGMPADVTALEDAIDSAAANRWVIGDAATIGDLKAEHFDFHSRTAANMLANAAELDNPDIALALLAEGAPVNGHAFSREDTPAGPRGPTAVEAAAEHGRADLVRALIRAGAFPADQPGIKEASLNAAVTSGDVATVSEILARRPDVNARNRDGTTPLMGSPYSPSDPSPDLLHRYAEIIRLLLAAGADVRLRDVDNRNALFGADGAEMVEVLVKAGASLETRDNSGDTPLLDANSDDGAMALIAAGADISAVNDKGDGLLEEATENKWPRCLAYLAAHPGSPRVAKSAPEAWPPSLPALVARHFDFHSRQAAVMLIRATNEGRDKLVLDLLAAGVAPNQVSDAGESDDARSAVGAAARQGKLELVRSLIAAGAFNDAPYHAKESVLFEAAGSAHAEVVSELLAAGADVNARDGVDGKTALMLVLEKTEPDDASKEAAWKAASAETIRRLIVANADVRLTDNSDETALHKAWNAEAVRLLLKAGADIEARDTQGQTPLLATIDDDVAMALIVAGADITARDDAGTTVLANAKSSHLKKTLVYLNAHSRRP